MVSGIGNGVNFSSARSQVLGARRVLAHCTPAGHLVDAANTARHFQEVVTKEDSNYPSLPDLTGWLCAAQEGSVGLLFSGVNRVVLA